MSGTDGEDDEDAALAALSRELAFEHSGHIYARECSANAWYAIGALHLRRQHVDQARAAFQQTLTRIHGHPLASAGLSAISPAVLRAQAPRAERTAPSVEQAIVQAAMLALRGNHTQAAQGCADALSQAVPGAAGWSLPLEPLLHATAHRDVWARALKIVHDRAL